MLNRVGVLFKVYKNDNGQTLHILVNEKKFETATSRPKTGRPVEHEFNPVEIQKMKDAGKTNKQIYTELGMSKSLFYKRMKECKNNSGQ